MLKQNLQVSYNFYCTLDDIYLHKNIVSNTSGSIRKVGNKTKGRHQLFVSSNLALL